MTEHTGRNVKGNRYRPSPGWLVVKPVPQQELRESGLIMPNNEQRRNVTGHVIAKGAPHFYESGVTLDLDVEVGDKVFFMKNAGISLYDRSKEDVAIMFVQFPAVIARIASDDEVADDAVDKDVIGEQEYGVA